ncbi:conserved protein of unknown function [Ruminococcaceae bacterium BL-6]|jgi:hypothetical protein|nr:conserved protein of unknown function [Ruminococcaceae bacterium BL-6]
MKNGETGRLLNLFEVGKATGHNFLLSKRDPVVEEASEKGIQELLSKNLISKIRDGEIGEDQYMITELGLKVRNGEIEL